MLPEGYLSVLHTKKVIDALCWSAKCIDGCRDLNKSHPWIDHLKRRMSTVRIGKLLTHKLALNYETTQPSYSFWITGLFYLRH